MHIYDAQTKGTWQNSMVKPALKWGKLIKFYTNTQMVGTGVQGRCNGIGKFKILFPFVWSKSEYDDTSGLDPMFSTLHALRKFW